MATRWYFPLDTVPDVSPAFAAWDVTTEAVRRRMVTAKGSSAIAGVTINPSGLASHCARQYVSDPLDAGKTIDGTVTGQVLAREFLATDDVIDVATILRVFSQDGLTLRATLISGPGSHGTFAELSSTGFRNQTFFNGDAVTSYTTLAGDRIVLEMGFTGQAAGAHQCAAKWGEAAADLPIDDTTTTDGAGWFEISNDLYPATAVLSGTIFDE